LGTRAISTMRDLGIWTPSRYMALFAVIAFHLVIIALLISSRASRPAISETSPIELVYLSSATTPKSRPMLVLPHSLKQEAEVLTPAPPSSIAFSLPALPDESAGPPIDWANEAHEVARATGSGNVRSHDRHQQSESSQPTKSIFADPPAHYAGEQFKTDGGQWIVFVSDDCYQISNPFASLDVLGNGLGVQTYCVGKSNTPRR
jgi:hypothetical protein